MKILYIAGYGRSGSSIVSRLLGASEGVLSLGEFGRFANHVKLNASCSCGLELNRCPVWSPIIRKGIHRPLEAILDASESNQYKVVIDSSKTAYYDFWRPLYYIIKGQNVKVLHLVRAPEKVLSSTIKGRNKDLERNIYRKRRFEFARTLIGWIFANFAASAYRLRFRRGGYLKVRYEEFIESPSVCLTKSEALIDHSISFSESLVSNGTAIPAGHEIAGNRALRDEEVFFVSRPRENPDKERRKIAWSFFNIIFKPIS